MGELKKILQGKRKCSGCGKRKETFPRMGLWLCSKCKLDVPGRKNTAKKL